MDLEECLRENEIVLMEGALGERLKREFRLPPHPTVALAAHIYQPEGREALRLLWTEYAAIAARYGFPFLATAPTRRANRERAESAGYGEALILDNAAFLQGVRRDCGGAFFIGGLMGCRGDAYRGTEVLSVREAREFHRWQAALFARAGVDFLYAGIMPALPEALGMAQAMGDTGLPYLISLMLRRDGRLIDGTPLSRAIEQIDLGAGRRPLGYMTNCVHPDVLYEALSQPFNRTPAVGERFLGIQANTAALPPEELDGREELACSPPNRLAERMVRLQRDFGLRIFGGCCGTDGSHMEELARRLANMKKEPS